MIIQRTPEWYREHVGRVTGSTIWRVMGSDKRRATLVQEKANELISGMITETHCNIHMQFGIDNEERAIMEYETVHGRLTEPGHWIPLDGWGCTPDAFVLGPDGYAGLLSAKCTMLERIMQERMAADTPIEAHYWQCMAEMAATGLPWCDIGLYCPFMENRDEWLFTRRVERNDSEIKAMLNALVSMYLR